MKFSMIDGLVALQGQVVATAFVGTGLYSMFGKAARHGKQHVIHGFRLSGVLFLESLYSLPSRVI